MRIVLGLEYDGSHYFGWQAQRFDQLPTIQAEVEKALSIVADHPIEVVCAGRTDAGVHATGQVIHFDTNVERSEFAWVMGANANLPKDISVRWAKIADENFHARYSAVARRYQYLIYNSRVRSALMHQRATLYPWDLDIERMQQAAQYLIGEHDFSSFRAAACQAKSPVRRLDYFKIEKTNHWITFEVQANAFLHHMVRNMVGSLMAVGNAQQEINWIDHVLKARDRRYAGVTAGAEGLYLVKVLYAD